MSYIVKERVRYWVVSTTCMGRGCLELGKYQHRGATSSGSRNTGGADSPMCLRNAYRGCPANPVFSPAAKAFRRKAGWKAIA